MQRARNLQLRLQIPEQTFHSTNSDDFYIPDATETTQKSLARHTSQYAGAGPVISRSKISVSRSEVFDPRRAARQSQSVRRCGSSVVCKQ